MKTVNDDRNRRSCFGALATVCLGLASPIVMSEAIEEIIVTANKREQSIQDVSSSVTAIGQDQMKRGGIQDISRLEHLVPGMRFGQSGNEVRLAVRGSRTNNVGSEAEQVVGIFEDGVYVPTTTQAMGAYVDVSRIEVLRGPQGTLYGRNTFGGTVNVITNEPEFDEIKGNLSVLYGNYDNTRFEGVVNIPLSEKLALRIVGMTDKRDGFIKNLNESGTRDDLRDKDAQLFRATAKWAPFDTFDATLRISKYEDDTNGSGIWGYQQIAGYVDGEFRLGHLYAPDNASDNFDQGPYVVNRNQRSTADTKNVSTTLSINWDVGFGTIKFVGNMTEFDGLQIYDPDYSDGGDPFNVGFAGWTSSQDTYSTELQLFSNEDAAFKWMLGYYYYKQKADWNWQALVDNVNQSPSWDTQGNYVSDSVGVFANATFDVFEDTRLLTGLRWAEDSKKRKDRVDFSTNPPVVTEEGDTGSWSKVLWKVGLEHDIDRDMMAYATVSTGYRAGGINFVAPNVPLRYDPESVTAYEIGLKSTFADGAATLNLAVFFNDYNDLQAASVIPTGDGATVLEFTESGGAINAKGLEAELHWTPDGRWNISATLSFLDAEFGDYTLSEINGLGNLGGRQNLDDNQTGLLQLKGWTPAMSPEFTFGLQIGYDFLLPNGSRLTPSIQTTYTSEYAAYDINVKGVFQEAHTKSDLRLTWTSPDESVIIEGFVLNFEDEAVLNRAVVFSPGGTINTATVQANWNDPRVWGLRVSYTF